MGQSHHAGHETRVHTGVAHALAVWARDEHRIAVDHAGRLSVDSTNEHWVRPSLAKPADVVEHRVGTAQVVGVHYLEGILSPGRRSVLVAVGHFHIGGDRGHRVPAHGRERVRQRLAVDLQFAGGRLQRVGLRVFHEVLEGDVAVVVARGALNLVHAELLELLVGQFALLGLALHAQLIDVFLSDTHGRHISRAVLVAHLHGSQLIEILLLHIEGVHISARDAQLLG